MLRWRGGQPTRASLGCAQLPGDGLHKWALINGSDSCPTWHERERESVSERDSEGFNTTVLCWVTAIFGDALPEWALRRAPIPMDM